MESPQSNLGAKNPEPYLEAKGERRDLDLTTPVDNDGEDDFDRPPHSSRR